MRIFKRLAVIALVGLLFGQVDGQKKGAAGAATTTPQATGDTTTSDQTTNLPTPASTGDSSPAQTGSTQTTNQQPSITGLPNAASSPVNGLPQLTSSGDLPSLATGLPKISQNPLNVPTYHVVIPQVADNPFLQTSNYPEDTVFIIVGSCLAGLALMLIASRAIYIWCLHRQTKQRGKDVKYSEMEQRPYTATSGNPPTAPFAGAAASGNNISLDYLRPGDRSSRVSTFSSRPSTGRPQTSSLRPVSNAHSLNGSSVQFYSPSAHPGGASAAALATQSSRDSAAYLPAGYYLRDSSSANNNASTASPRQMYNTPAPTTSFLYSDPSAPPIPRLSRPQTGNSASTMTASGGGGTTRPATANTAGSGFGGGYNNGGGNSRPISANSIGQGGYSGGQGYPQARRAPSSSNGETFNAYPGDRRSKPTQALDDLLGGR
jgi:hypothetical protein